MAVHIGIPAVLVKETVTEILIVWVVSNVSKDHMVRLFLE